jgi:tRNA-specific adenosine deaminase 3
LLAETQSAIESRAGIYLALARKVAHEAKQSGRGRAVGAVVVDPAITDPDRSAGIIAIAGDARYWNPVSDDQPSQPDLSQSPAGACPEPEESHLHRSNLYDADQEGHPAHHAVMRAIAMIANQRLSSSATSSLSSPSQPQTTTATSSPPLTYLESCPMTFANVLARAQGGYLCTALDLYVTHEPCVCCAMGMLLSRFRAVIFVKRTGRPEMAALDPEAGYGLHWRRELNWRALAFEFVEEDSGDGEGEGEDEEGEFHA